MLSAPQPPSAAGQQQQQIKPKVRSGTGGPPKAGESSSPLRQPQPLPSEYWGLEGGPKAPQQVPSRPPSGEKSQQGPPPQSYPTPQKPPSQSPPAAQLQPQTGSSGSSGSSSSSGSLANDEFQEEKSGEE